MTILSTWCRLKYLKTEGILIIKVVFLQDEFKGMWYVPWAVVGGHVDVSLCTKTGGIIWDICREQRVPDLVQPYLQHLSEANSGVNYNPDHIGGLTGRARSGCLPQLQ